MQPIEYKEEKIFTNHSVFLIEKIHNKLIPMLIDFCSISEENKKNNFTIKDSSLIISIGWANYQFFANTKNEIILLESPENAILFRKTLDYINEICKNIEKYDFSKKEKTSLEIHNKIIELQKEYFETMESARTNIEMLMRAKEINSEIKALHWVTGQEKFL